MPQRLVFLQKFTQELVLNSIPEELKPFNIEKKEKNAQIEIRNKLTAPIKEQIKHELAIHKINYYSQHQPQIIQQKQFHPKQINPKISDINPFEQNTVQEEWGKITPMILDPNVISIESTGAGKFVIVRTATKSIPTRVMLNNEEIEEIIDKFSRESRIPRIGGVFKAIVNNLVITAIDSEHAATRFIISKIHPRRSEYL